jgi:transposase
LQCGYEVGVAQVTVFSGAQRRRRWSDDEKLALVEAAIAPGASIAEVARAADVDVSLIYRWRRELCGPRRKSHAAPTRFVELSVEADRSADQSPDTVLVIVVKGATLRAPSGASAVLLGTALRELLA